MMLCPEHNLWMKKARLDIYWCDVCEKAWLIHKLSNYKSLEEASKVSDEETLRQVFFEPLRHTP